MRGTNPVAFKEWAVVCAALASGRQSLILRKGGIHEGREGFRVEHDEFWLFATAFHQAAEDVIASARDLWEHTRDNPPPEGTIRLPLYVTVDDVISVTDGTILPRLEGHHIWSPHVLSQRFNYRTPGLFALIVRAWQPPAPIHLPDSPHLAGCRSWVDLPKPLPTHNLHPVLSDKAHQQRTEQLRSTLTPPQIT